MIVKGCRALGAAGLARLGKPVTIQDKAMLQRHGGRWNEVFCDGHVENRTLNDLFDFRKDDVSKLWNRDNQVHRN